MPIPQTTINRLTTALAESVRACLTAEQIRNGSTYEQFSALVSQLSSVETLDDLNAALNDSL